MKMLLTCSKSRKPHTQANLKQFRLKFEQVVLQIEGDVVASKHIWKRYLEPFFLASLREDLHRSNDGIFERTTGINWLEPSEEDALVYTAGNEDNNNPPQCILDIALNSGSGW